MNNPLKKISISIVGAGGMVGKELIELIYKRNLPFSELKFYGSKEKIITISNRRIKIEKIDKEQLKKSNIIFFVSSDDVSKKYAKKFSQMGIWCIDDSSAFRLDKDVPIIIPEINSELINEKYRLIAGPNCTITPLAISCHKIHKKFKIKELRIATYQSVSGAGKDAIDEFLYEIRSFIKTGKVRIKKKILPRQIAFNLFPQVGSFDKKGNSDEENKVEAELKKIWNDDEIKISCYAVRVPVIRGHSLAVWVKTKRRWKEEEIISTLKDTKGVKFFEDHKNYKTPIDCEKKYEIYVSRFKKTPFENEFSLWLCGDNLYKGAALNSIQIAEIIIKKYFV